MGSTDYLKSARRAAIVFAVLALAALGAAAHRLAVSAWGAAPVALGPVEKTPSEPRRRVRAACGSGCANVRTVVVHAGDGAAS